MSLFFFRSLYRDLFRFDSDYEKEKHNKSAKDLLNQNKLKLNSANNYNYSSDERIGIFNTVGEYVPLSELKNDDEESENDEEV